MLKQLFVLLLAVILTISFSTLALSQDKKEAKKEPKMEMAKGDKAMGPLKSLACDDACGFMVRGRNEKEIMSIMKNHAKKTHKMEMTDKQMKEMMKTEEGMK